MSRPQLLMCAPDHFEVTYAINPWMQTGAVNAARAQDQWRQLQAALSEHADVSLMPPVAGLPDLVFTANAGTLRGNVFVPSRFRHPERRGEEAHFAAWFAEQGYSVRHLPEGVVSEGAGDAVVDLDLACLWMGYGPRSDLRAAGALSRILNLEVVPLSLVDARFYHVDTCFCPLPGGGAMYFANAFDGRGRAEIEARIPRSRRILLTEAEACQFACNAVVVGEHVFMNQGNTRLVHDLRGFGLRVHEVALDEFIKAGGSARCLTMRLDVPVQGSYRSLPELRQSA